MSSGKIKEVVEELWSDPKEKNWERFSKSLKVSGIKYYKVVFEKGNKLKKLDDLRDSYVALYDGKSRQVYKVPLIKKDGKALRGATIYLKGLLNLNK